MSGSNQKGLAQIFLVLILLAGIGLGVYLVGQKTNLFPRASVSTPVAPQTSFILNDPQATKAKVVGSEFEVQVWARSDIEPANLFAAKLQFPPHLLEVVGLDFINRETTFVESWVEDYFDNNAGEVSLVGGVPSPGLTTTNGPARFMASVIFRVKDAGTAVVLFSDESAIYSNANNINILTIKEPLTALLGTSTALPSATPSASPVDYCTPCSADLSKNGKVSAVDYSISITCISNGISGQDGTGRACTVADIDRDGAVTEKDLECVKRQYAALCPTNTASPSPIPTVGSGDGNNDGKVNLADLSMLLSNFNKTSGFPKPIDLNGDGKVNSIDYGLMVQILLKAGVIKGGSVG